MIILFDFFDKKSKDLYYSLITSGLHGNAVVINDDGFLPQNINSPYSFFCNMEGKNGNPLYFNQVPLPDLWEIKGNNIEAEIWDFSIKRAKIFYQEPKYKRQVKNIDWFDNNKKVRYTDHYNRFGWCFARTHFDKNQNVTTKSYFDKDGKEVIVENFRTGVIILNWLNKDYFFDNRVAFLNFYFSLMGWNLSRIWYNSLSTLFFVSYRMTYPGEDILFWQEDIEDTIPANMRVLLESTNTRTQKVIVQKKNTYHKIKSMLPKEQQEKIGYLGFIYPNKKNNKGRKDIFILTNSDQIEHLEVLVHHLSDYHFHIAAYTEMSFKLMSFSQEQNVTLYPNISRTDLDNLFEICDIYFDINHGNEVDDVIRRAFEYNHLIFAFDNTCHNRELVLDSNIISHTTCEQLINLMKNLSGSIMYLLEQQREQTSNETKERYKEILGGYGNA
ncbi:TPA: accessory Sec system glycosylation chaperone GtfB [Streptococcus agalactiae]|nr:accessory Sec system glycosylation chaperone GtfB [Streptococcus agalactiae]